MTDYERELKENGELVIINIYNDKRDEPFIPMSIPTKRPVSPYAKFDKFHRKKKRR